MCSVENIRPVGQAAKTSPSQGENMGSIPVRVTKSNFRRTPIVGIRLISFLSNQIIKTHYFGNVSLFAISKTETISRSS